MGLGFRVKDGGAWILRIEVPQGSSRDSLALEVV